MPALRAAAAARECGGVWAAGGEGLAGLKDDVEAMRLCMGVVEGDGDGGRELRSGGMGAVVERRRKDGEII
jgi:hypothetical protein